MQTASLQYFQVPKDLYERERDLRRVEVCVSDSLLIIR